VEQVQHIVFCKGITLIIQNSKATLKGVQAEAIIKVFSPKIFQAITKEPV
jgi:hypothetical protein